MTTTQNHISEAADYFRQEKLDALKNGALSFGRCGGNASGAQTRYRVTCGSHFLGYAFATGRGWAAEGAWRPRPIVTQDQPNRAAAGEALRLAAIEALRAGVR